MKPKFPVTMGGMAKGQTVNAYLAAHHLKALVEVVEEKGVSQPQVVKELIIEGLVKRGKLQQLHLDAVLGRQFGLYMEPHGNAKSDLVQRSGAAKISRKEKQEAEEKPIRRRRRGTS